MLAQLGTSQNIEIMTKAEVVEFSQRNSGYRLRVKQGPRYVDPDRCVACGVCSKKCPVSETCVSPFYDRKWPAIYLPSMHAIPRGYVIDQDRCLFLKDGSCRICEGACPKGAINLDQNPKEMELEVQGVILAAGVTPFDPRLLQNYGYGKLENVVTNIEFESLVDPGGVSSGRVIRPSDGKEPRSIAWIQCVGSRQTNRINRPYCSSICCSAAIKQAITARQLVEPAPETDIYFVDVMAHQKGAERYFRCAREKGVRFIRSKPYGVSLQKDGGLVIETYNPDEGRKSRSYDMVVLSTGIEISETTKRLALNLGIETDDFGFNTSSHIETEATVKRRIFACGTINGPKSIAGSVIEGSAAAALCRKTFGSLAIQQAKKKIQIQSNSIPLQPPKVGVFICCCGTNISSRIHMKRLVDSLSLADSDIDFCTTLSFACAPDGAEVIARQISKRQLNRLVIAACTPRSHEMVFKQAAEEAGLDPSMVVVANIREQGVWAHGDDPKGLFYRVRDQILMAVKKAKVLIPYKKRQYPVVKKALVLGGGISGMTCAAILAESGIHVSLVEKNDRLGGNALSLMKTWRGMEVGSIIKDLYKRLRYNPLVSIYMNSFLTDIQGLTGNLTAFVTDAGTDRVDTLDVGAFILATGAKEAKPEDYLYGCHPAVLTHQDLDRLLIEEDVKRFDKIKCVVFIQCVGSCDSKRPYCSRVCCTHTITRAVYLKEKLPHLNIFILYKHMRTYGQRDDYFRRAREMGIRILRFKEEALPKLYTQTGLNENLEPVRELRLEFYNELTGSDTILHPDYVFLASAIEPDLENNNQLSNILKLPLGPDGFFQEVHPKLRPNELKRDGFFVAGLAHYPKEVEESMSQAAAAASKAMAFLAQDKVTLERQTAQILVEMCDGCGLCVDVCAEKAISMVEFMFKNEVKMMAEIDDSVCTGCGACVGVCPKYAVGIPGYMPQEIAEQINTILNVGMDK